MTTRLRARFLSPTLRLCITFLPILALACDRGASTGPATDFSAPLALSLVPSASAAASSAGIESAFGKADRLHARVVRSSDEKTLVDDDLPFDPSSAGESATLSVPLDGPAATLLIDIAVGKGPDDLFRGSTTAAVAIGRSSSVELSLQPVPAAIAAPGQITLEALQATIHLGGAVVFATGDTIPDLRPTWTDDGSGIVDVSPDGNLVALEPGEAHVTATYEQLTTTTVVDVSPRAAQVTVDPATVRIATGATQQFQATIVDANGFQVDRPVTWTSSDEHVAVIDADGVATGVAEGTATITAAADGVSGSAQLEVSAVPIVTSGSATGVGATQASLNGTVNPNGSATTAWFEWGGTTSFGNTTPTQTIGSGDAPVDVQQTVVGFQDGQTYYFRIVAKNAAGTSTGETKSFKTRLLPPAAPSNVVPVGRTSGVVVGWSDNSDNESGFRIERKFSGDTTWISLGSTSADQTSFLDNSAVAGNSYDYRVQACNAAGCSTFSYRYEFYYAPDVTIPSGMPSVSPTPPDTVYASCGSADIGPWSIRNQGTASAGSFTYGYYLSTDATIDKSDTLLKAGSVGSLDPGASVTIPSTTVGLAGLYGNYWIGIRLDPGTTLPEGNTYNNWVSRSIYIYACLY